MNKEENIPPFIQGYLDEMDYDGYPAFVKLSREYQKEMDEYPGKFAMQSQHLKQFNHVSGQNHKLNYQDGVDRIQNHYQQRAFEIAKDHGYSEKNPEKPYDQEFTSHGERFQNRIDQTRQSQTEKPVADNKPEIKSPTEEQKEKRMAFLEELKKNRDNITQIEPEI